MSTITKFRKDLFHLSDLALKGETVQFVYRGAVLRLTPEKQLSKLDRLVGQPVVSHDYDPAAASRELLAEMESEWAKDWSDL